MNLIDIHELCLHFPRIPFCLQYVSSVPVWSPQCDDATMTPNAAGATNPNEGLLENLIHQHQSLYELMCLNYTEVGNRFNQRVSKESFSVCVYLFFFFPPN